MQQRPKHIVLVGNPNNGKSSLFTQLTGIYQKANNYPGVTVEKREGIYRPDSHTRIRITDLPGLYSLYPYSEDEQIAYTQLLCPPASDCFDLALVLVDASNLKRNLLLVSQLIDAGIPMVLCLTMVDVAQKQGIKVSPELLSSEFGVPVISINPTKKKSVRALGQSIDSYFANLGSITSPSCLKKSNASDAYVVEIQDLLPSLQEKYPHKTTYALWHVSLYPTLHLLNAESLTKSQQEKLLSLEKKKAQFQAEDVTNRYTAIRSIVSKCEERELIEDRQYRTDRIDNWLLHPVWGYLFLFTILMSCFQAIFYLAEYPMELIDRFFLVGNEWMTNQFPVTWWSSLLVDGIWSGLNGILVFIPQIAMLFAIIGILEDSGYMSRISFLMDRWARLFGLSGKSVVAFANAFACAVPAVLSTRHISSKQERLLTILVAPFMACSARLPVYFILISIMIPSEAKIGFFGLQGFVMFGLYVFGIVMAFVVSWVLKSVVAKRQRSIFLQELPIYRLPYWGNILRVMYTKCKVFVFEAGKIIIIISLIIWGLSSYGPSIESSQENFQKSRDNFSFIQKSSDISTSYMGHIGQWIEPSIRPLGYDWKIGIALLTSFAAREVFVGTVSTLYAVEDSEEASLISRMRSVKHADGRLVYTLPTILSLLIFYALAMQCMSTTVVVFRETGSWKYPLLQFIIMTGLAYMMAFAVYRLTI